MNQIRKKIEALLYAAGNRISVEDLAVMSGESKKDIQKAIKELQEEYATKDCALTIVHDKDLWKMTIRPEYLELVSGLVKKTELDHPTMETLAFVAYKHPALQSEVVKMRGSVAYEHLKLLEELGFVKREPKGRSKIIRLTDLFYDYFDVNEHEKKQFFDAVKDQEKQLQQARQDAAARETEIKEQLKEMSEQHGSGYSLEPQETEEEELPEK